MNKTVAEKLEMLPTDPGCYLMKNKQNEIIYVGKAKNLKNRVSSYFTGAHDHKTTKMVSNIHDFEFIITSTEKESLILEINLIKEHRPRFNILFMDDKSYPYLKISKTGKPEVMVARDRKQSPKFTYFGPYPDATAAREMARLLNESAPQGSVLLPNRDAIYSQFNRTQKEYTEEELETWRQNVVSVLNGNIKDFTDVLEKKMIQASENLEFELAQTYKDRLDALRYISDKQQVQFAKNENFDLFHYAYYQGYIAIVGLFVRAGRLLERTMAIEPCMEEPDESLFSFIAQFYENQPVPKIIYVPEALNAEDLQDILGTEVKHALRGKKRTLLDITQRNAKQQITEQFTLLKKRQDFRDDALLELQNVLGFKDSIHRIEIFDNSHISGSYAVSACVVFDDGEPNKSQYRRYRLHQGNDDVASMKEVLYRRYFRILKEGKVMPDLICVDGGKGQLGAALEIKEMLDLDVTICGLVKDDRHRTHALMNENMEIMNVDERSPLFGLLVQMQDEVHRFVISYHKLLRKKAMTKSILDEVAGLGPTRQKKLFKEFGNLKNIKEASVEELSRVVPKEIAEELYDILNIDWGNKNA